MKRILSLILTGSILALSLSGCHGSMGLDAFVMPEELDTYKEIEISFWAKNDTNKTQTAIYQQAIDDFEALYPNINVNMRLYTDYGRIYNDVITNISTQTTPNVCISYPDHIATYMSGSNTIVTLDELMVNESYGLGGSKLLFDSPTKDEIIPQFLTEGQLNGEQIALPYMRSTEACYINVDLLNKLGYELPDTLTWDFIWEVSDKAAEKNPDGTYKLNGQNVMIPFIYKSTDNMMIQMLRQLDAGYSNEAGEIAIFNDTTKELLYGISEHVEKGAFSTFKISSYPGNFLNAGQCIFAIDSTAGATWMGSYAPLSDISADKFVEFETAVRTIPQFNVDEPKMISQGPSLCIFNKADPQEVLASWLFTQYLLTNEVQIAYAQTEGYVPVTSKAQNSEVYQDYISRKGENNELYYDVKIEASELLLDNVEHTFTTAVFNGSTSLRDTAGQLIESVVKSTRRGETVDEAYMERLFEETTALYRLDQIGGVGSIDMEKDLGPLPAGSKVLLGALALIWLCLGTVFILNYLKEKKVKE